MIVLAMIDVEAIIYPPDVSSMINGLFNIILTLAQLIGQLLLLVRMSPYPLNPLIRLLLAILLLIYLRGN